MKGGIESLLEDKDIILNFIEETLEELNNYYIKVDESRNKILAVYHSLFSNVRNVFNLLYKGDLETSRTIIEDIINELEKINRLIRNCNKGEKLEKIMRDLYRETVEVIFLYIFLSEDQRFLSKISFIDKTIIIEGFFEFLGEVRRFFLDEIISNNLDKVRYCLDFLDLSYKTLLSKYFPNYFFPDYKRRLDILRSQVERSKEDYIRVKYGGCEVR